MSRLQDEQAWLRTGSLVVLATIAVAGALMYTRDVMLPFVLAVFIYVSACPLMDFLVLRAKMPRLMAVAVTLLAVLGLFGLFGFLVAGSTAEMFETAKRYQKEFQQRSDRGFAELNAFLERHGWKTGEFVQLVRVSMLDAFNQVVTMVFNLLMSSFLVVLFLVFFLAGRRPGLAYAQVYREIHRDVRRYLLIKFSTCAATGVLVWLALAWLGLELAPLFGIITFVLNFIPTIGALVAVLLPLPIALAQFGDPLAIAGVLVLPGVVQLGIGYFLEPKLLGQGLQLHPVTIILALAFWGLLWGPAGMVLAAPMTAALRIICLQFETTRPAGELLSGQLPATAGKPA